jgi:hypothetical protein
VIASSGATCIDLPAGEFTYGHATNLGIQRARGELILMLSPHSLPVGTCFLDEVMAPFRDPRVAAVRIPMTANTRELLTAGELPPLDRRSTPAEIYARGPAASGSVLRRSVWEQFPVDETLEAAEDKDWALRVLHDSEWIMPVANACYVYAKTYTREAWIRKLALEERAGLRSAGLRRDADWLHVVKTFVAGGRDLWNSVRTESALYRLRRHLR